MDSSFYLGRRYEREEVLAMLVALQGVGDNQLRNLLAVWEEELRGTNLPRLIIIEETVITV